MADDKVGQAMKLLKEAGWLDLLVAGVLRKALLTKCAAAGVAAAVLACLPLHPVSRTRDQISPEAHSRAQRVASSGWGMSRGLRPAARSSSKASYILEHRVQVRERGATLPQAPLSQTDKVDGRGGGLRLTNPEPGVVRGSTVRLTTHPRGREGEARGDRLDQRGTREDGSDVA
ncbi:hypothetical protein NDU88_003745 [Pleurodeles waltl]|uniref:Uncharacterized protein n=1 Tax=Pleurodeles waltl TaxID=8319 RepID=A0AAV7TQK2_PLEWA|nr:hypothetical protein NDU88_003745 [Pleurodeles waltl]